MSLLVDKVSWYMRFFLTLPNKYYTFVTSPFLSASPSPAPFCSIFRGPNRLDLWLDLCLKLLFDCHKNEGLLHISFTATFYSLQKFPNTSIRLSSLWSGTMVSQNHNGTCRMTRCHDQKRWRRSPSRSYAHSAFEHSLKSSQNEKGSGCISESGQEF